MKQYRRFLLHAVTLDVHRLLTSYMLDSCSLRSEHVTSQLLERRSTQSLGACIRSMFNRVDVFEMYYLMGNFNCSIMKLTLTRKCLTRLAFPLYLLASVMRLVLST